MWRDVSELAGVGLVNHGKVITISLVEKVAVLGHIGHKILQVAKLLDKKGDVVGLGVKFGVCET